MTYMTLNPRVITMLIGTVEDREIRRWAAGRKIACPRRGAIPQDVREAWWTAEYAGADDVDHADYPSGIEIDYLAALLNSGRMAALSLAAAILPEKSEDYDLLTSVYKMSADLAELIIMGGS